MSDQWKARRDHARAVERQRAASGDSSWYMLCLKSVRTSLGVGPGNASAKDAWAATDEDDRYPVKLPPPGVPGYLDHPNGSKYGHIVLVEKTGDDIDSTLVWSNDIKGKGKISLVSIGYIKRNWGMKWLGFATTLNGERIHPVLPHDGK